MTTSPDLRLEDRAGDYPLVVSAFQSLLEAQAAYAAIPAAALRHGPEIWSEMEARAEEILHLCDGDRDRFREGVGAWLEFSYEFLSRQREFHKTGQYKAKPTDLEALYADSERMGAFYLTALMFSYLFSSNYIGFYEFFRRRMLPKLAEAREVCDVGCGHGVYLSGMLRAAPSATGLGIDVSRGSLETAARLLAFRIPDPSRYRLDIADVQSRLPVPEGSQDGVTCFEVIEHLEHPDAALAELRRSLRSGGTLCLSTAIRMESVDHIHLFREPEDARRLVESAGFKIIDEEVIPLTTEDVSIPDVRARLIADPKTALGYVLLATPR